MHEKLQDAGEHNIEILRGKKMKLKNTTNFSKYIIIGAIATSVLAIFTVVLLSIIKSDKGSTQKNTPTYTADTLGEIENGDHEVYTTGVFLSADITNKRITVCDIVTNEEIDFFYSGSTVITDKYDQLITVSQLIKGQVVKLSHITKTRNLTKLSISHDIWENIGISDVIINKNAKVISYLGNNYSYSDGTVFISDGKLISVDEIMSLDYLTIRGWEENIYSVVVTGGHGYLELTGEETFIGGTIHVGTQLTEQITENMRLTVREGTYTVTVKNKKAEGSKEITITRDQTSVCDINEFALAKVEEGNVLFNITPQGALLLIDQVATDYSSMVTLPVGNHMIEVSLGGYKSYSGTLYVDKGNTSTSINLQVNDNSSTSNQDNENSSTGNDSMTDEFYEDNISEDNTSEGNSSENTDSVWEGDNMEEEDDNIEEEDEDDYTYESGEVPSGIDKSKTITIYWITGAEVYFNGEIVGTIVDGKLSVPKQYGEISVDLVIYRDGIAQTVTHSIVVDNDGQNVSYHFPEELE